VTKATGNSVFEVEQLADRASCSLGVLASGFGPGVTAAASNDTLLWSLANASRGLIIG
jgi:hypothetical protein